MRKLRLDLDSFEVESFETGEVPDQNGTVRARSGGVLGDTCGCGGAVEVSVPTPDACAGDNTQFCPSVGATCSPCTEAPNRTCYAGCYGPYTAVEGVRCTCVNECYTNHPNASQVNTCNTTANP